MRLCFVIMPIGSDDAYRVYLNRYENLIKPAIEGVERNGARVYKSLRADFISSTGSINRTVLQHIYDADVVLADVTDLNPNVFYELGVRHSLRNGTILLALKGTKLPFDVGDLNVVFYEDKLGGEKAVIPRIRELLDGLIDSKTEDSPVFFVLPDLQNAFAGDLGESKARNSALEKETTELRVKLAVAEQVNLSLRDSVATFERTMNAVIERFAPEERALSDKAVQDALHQQEQSARRTLPVISGIEQDPKAMFVLMPFHKGFEGVYGLIREVGESLGLRVFRADEMTSPGLITDQIFEAIFRAGIILADITGKNPNVLYEIGLAHSLMKETILISQVGETIPFDIASMRVIMYENTVSGSESLKTTLYESLKSIIEKKRSG